jgi:hypothetical protein
VNWPLSAGTRVASFLLVTPFFNFKDTVPVLQLDGSSAHVRLHDNEIYAAPLLLLHTPCLPPLPPVPFRHSRKAPFTFLQQSPPPRGNRYTSPPNRTTQSLCLASFRKVHSGGSHRLCPSDVNRAILPRPGRAPAELSKSYLPSTICSGESADAWELGSYLALLPLFCIIFAVILSGVATLQRIPAPCSLHISRSDPPAPSPHLSSIRGGRSFR